MTPDTHNKLAFGRNAVSSVAQELQSLRSVLHAVGLDKLAATVGHSWEVLLEAHTLIDEGINEAVRASVQDAEQASINMVRAAIAGASN